MRIITSPVKRFPGTVVMPDALTFPQFIAWHKAINTSRPMGGAEGAHEIVKGLLVIVQEWHIENLPDPLTAENFPSTPTSSVSKLLAWLRDDVDNMLDEADEAPNA